MIAGMVAEVCAECLAKSPLFCKTELGKYVLWSNIMSMVYQHACVQIFIDFTGVFWCVSSIHWCCVLFCFSLYRYYLVLYVFAILLFLTHTCYV